jgi:putative ABC transport system permease protein
MNLVIRTSGDPSASIGLVRREISALDKDQPVAKGTSLETLLASSTSQKRFNMLLMGLFALVALILAVVGIYAVTAYSVNQRSHEIGIRMALGATRGEILKLVIRKGLKLVIIGVVIGLGGAFALTRLISGLLFGVSATDPITFLTITILLVVVALVATYFPARKATKVDPIVVLRNG